MGSNVETHRATMEAFNNRDWAAAAGPMREDAIYTDHPRGESVKGPVELVDWMKEWAAGFSDGRSVDHRFIDGGDYTVCLFRAQGTNDGPMGPLPATGRRIDVPFCEVFHYDSDGKIVSGEMFYDVMTMMVQLGHAEPMPTS
ncbi:ester cyclase [Phytohabitans sp. LJ34]|uniref:ester cyclase n=1 Tax=Phytohabitans sp. LJ34 TaxID=3452217 RepID=UPI003F89DF3D